MAWLPSISRVDDQHVGIVYEGSQADLVFEKLSLNELPETVRGVPRLYSWTY